MELLQSIDPDIGFEDVTFSFNQTTGQLGISYVPYYASQDSKQTSTEYIKDLTDALASQVNFLGLQGPALATVTDLSITDQANQTEQGKSPGGITHRAKCLCLDIKACVYHTKHTSAGSFAGDVDQYINLATLLLVTLFLTCYAQVYCIMYFLVTCNTLKCDTSCDSSGAIPFCVRPANQPFPDSEYLSL